MLKSPQIKQSLARMEKTYNNRKSKRTTVKSKFKATPFWTSQSMLLQLTKKELQSLPNEVQNIRDIRPNRKLSVPVIRANKPLAIETEDRLSTTWGLERSNAFGAWGVYGAEGQGVTVGVLDTGIDPDHPDLAGKIAHWAEFDDMGNIIDT
ncbi:MAG: S8 family serine peptidase, partial [Fuerstiella sp.]|nr:S8 family serine peptidase [Fuerstiella sp.]